MPLHQRLRQRADNLQPNSSLSLDNQYKRAIPFLKFLTEDIKKGVFTISVIKELQSGNPNVERLLFYREGYEAAMKTFLDLINTDKGEEHDRNV